MGAEKRGPEPPWRAKLQATDRKMPKTSSGWERVRKQNPAFEAVAITIAHKMAMASVRAKARA